MASKRSPDALTYVEESKYAAPPATPELPTNRLAAEARLASVTATAPPA